MPQGEEGTTAAASVPVSTVPAPAAEAAGASSAAAVSPDPPAASAASPTSGPLSSWIVPTNSSNATNLFAHHTPTPSVQARPRAQERTSSSGSSGDSSNQSAKKRKTPGRNGSNNAATISAHDRVRQFPGEGLAVSNGKLFCDPCGKTLSTDSETIKFHIGLRKPKNP